MIKEKTIKIEELEIKELENLQSTLENNKVINIKNILTDSNIMIVEYEDKELDIDKEFELAIKLIRDKYYRKLLNVVDKILKFKIPEKSDEISYVFDETGRSYKIFLKDYVDIYKYKEKLKIALINYIGLYNFDNIFELTKEEMLKLKIFSFNPNSQQKNVFEFYGMFCHRSDELLKVLKKALDADRFSKINRCNRFIIICPELIREYCIEQFDKYKSQGIIDESQLFTVIYNKVLTHELGHAVFDYINDFNNEKRANFFSSLTFDGAFDNYIKLFTEHQDERYKDPILITKDETNMIKKIIYNIE